VVYGERFDIFDRIVCLVDGSPEGFGALEEARLLAPYAARIVAVIPFDLAAAARTRCQAGSTASAWDAQAELIRRRAAAALRGAWGYARIIEGNRLSTIVRAAGQEGSTTLALPATTLDRRDLRNLLRGTDGSILVSRGTVSARGALRVLAEEGLSDVAEDIAWRLGIGASPRTVAGKAVLAESRSADLTLVRGDPQPRRFSLSLAQAVASHAPSSVLIVRTSGADRPPTLPTPAAEADLPLVTAAEPNH
jgi:hypothetical protein